MVKDPIIVVADRSYHPFYETLTIHDERIVIHDLADAYESIGLCGSTVMLLDAGHTPEKGLQLLVRVKQCCVSVPIIFLTDVSSEDLVLAAFKAGIREYFKKPVSLEEIRNSVAALLDLKRSSYEARIPHKGKKEMIERVEGLCLTSDLPDNILRSVRFFNDHLSERIYLDEVAEEAGMSKFHFCRMFKQYLGMSPMQFLTISRIERAKLLLRKSGSSITSVIYKVGFNDISEFNRQFKKVTGMTPSSFKAVHKGHDQDRHDP